MLNAWATRLASMCHGTLVRSAASPTTGPATPKHAEPNPVAPDSTARKAEIISGRPEKSSVRNVRIASARGRDEVLSNTPSRVDVPPTSPTSTFVIDNRFILLHLDAVSPVCPTSGGRVSAPPEPSSHQPLQGQVVVFTGKLSSLGRKDASALVTRLGATTNEDVNAKTTMLVVGAERFGTTSDASRGRS